MSLKLQTTLAASSLLVLLGGIFAFAPAAGAANAQCTCSAVDDRLNASEEACRAACEGVGLTPNYAGGVCSCSSESFADSECRAIGDGGIFRCTVGAAAGAGGAAEPESSVDLASLNPLGETDIRVIIGRIIKYALGIVGSLALLMFIYGGGLWLLSGGQSERIEKGRNTILWATIGLGVIFASYALVNFVIKALTQ